MMYVVLFVKKSNHASVVGVFNDESLAKVYCHMKNEDAWIDKGRYDYRMVPVLDSSPEIAKYVLDKQR